MNLHHSLGYPATILLEDDPLGDREYNQFLGVLRILFTYTLIAALVVFARPTFIGVAVGFLFVAAGEAIRFWASGHLLKTQELITSGPYRYTRNPLYLGRLLIFTGLCIMARLPYGANWTVLFMGWLVFLTYYLPRKERVEPQRLRTTHGEVYERYFNAVPALLPSLRPYPEPSPQRWSAERMKRNREYLMVLGLLAVTLLFLWRAVR